MSPSPLELQHLRHPPSNVISFNNDIHEGFPLELDYNPEAATTGLLSEISNSNNNERQGQRQVDEVERVGPVDCRLITKLETPYPGSQAVTGTMFSIRANQTLDILGFEFDYLDTADGGELEVEVYYREGGYENVLGMPGNWTQIASSVALPAPEGYNRGAIIPTNDITSVTTIAGQLYSFYITLKSSHLRVSSSIPREQASGDIWESNSWLEIQVGVGLEGYPISDAKLSLSNVNFHGVIHYAAVQPCEEIRSYTNVILDFAINSEPTGDAIFEHNEAVWYAVAGLSYLNPDLIRYVKFHGLELINVKTGFKGRSGTFFLFVLGKRVKE
jgi:hypothetical protein